MDMLQIVNIKFGVVESELSSTLLSSHDTLAPS